MTTNAVKCAHNLTRDVGVWKILQSLGLEEELLKYTEAKRADEDGRFVRSNSHASVALMRL